MRWLRIGGAGLGALRFGLGVVALIRPSLVARPWVGATEAAGSATSVLGRAAGSRDVAIGVGTLLSARRTDGGLMHWTLAGTFCDAVDVTATAVAWRQLPTPGRVLVAASAIGGVAAGALISAGLAASERAGSGGMGIIA